MMSPYRVLAARSLENAGVETMIGGPGIRSQGVPYWFSCEQELHSFMENLNISYSEAKRLARWRKAQVKHGAR